MAILTLVNEQTSAKSRFAQYVEPEMALLFRMAQRMTGSKVEAEDLLQECLLRAYKSLDTFDGSYPRAWLITILRNLYLNRGRVKQHILVDDWGFLENGANAAMRDLKSTNSAEVEYLSGGLSDEIARALTSLSREFQEVLYLIDIEGFSYEEASLFLGVKKATITTRLSRARGKLRECLIENPTIMGAK